MKYINLHTHHFSENSNIIEIVNQYPYDFDTNATYFSIGIHPWHINELKFEKEVNFIKSKISEEKCLAIGECGLDKRTEMPFDLQLKVFESQLNLAGEYNKPVIIHCVAAFNELIAIKKRLKIDVPMIVHGFSQNAIVAKTLIDNGFYISFGKYLMTNLSLETVFKLIENSRFFLETDSSDYKIEEIYKKAAQIKSISIDELAMQIKHNFDSVFNYNNLVKS